MINRYLEGVITQHLKEYRQMAFITGPRQVGKTTLAKGLISNLEPTVNYFNWDIIEHRKILLKEVFHGKIDFKDDRKKIVVFDEIHKYPRWKNTLKGLFDKNEPNTHWVVTGSAALDVYRKGQDSLLGRCFNYHLSPLSVAEVIGRNIESMSVEEIATRKFEKPSKDMIDTFSTLINFGGFPEPFLKGEKTFLAKWRRTRLERIINQDLSKTEHLKNLPLVENLMFLLPERVGSPLSLNSLREDLEVHHATVKHWIQLLERVFYGFRIYPYSGRLSRTLKKEPKWYLWDWTEIVDEGFRFENMVAVHLLKYVNYINDTGLGNLSLHYIRDKEKREVDFLICKDRKPEVLIECKLKDKVAHDALVHYANVLHTKRAIQLIAGNCDLSSIKKGHAVIEIIPAPSFLMALV
ncbi:ATP-binding protein [bacterium]|nr:ATP-binding protein [bacterium]